MTTIDYAIIVLYFATVIGIGIYCRRLAAKNLDSYFLADKSMHWLALAMSGSVATFDITGTMWIVTLLTLFGMKSMWNHWMWGFLMAAFFMSYMGKWVRRSGVMTGAEWMVTRFGDSVDGKTARISYTIMAVVMLTGFIGYAFQGIGKFVSVYITFGLPPEKAATVGAIIVFSITTLYVLLGGLYSVVVTNVIQTVILTIASLVIAGVAYFQISPSMLEKVLPADWASLMPTWRLENAAQLPEAYAGYELFGALVIIWVLKGLLLNLGGPGQMTDFQAFLAARDSRDACKLGAAWSGFLVVRWAMCMGIALLAVTGLGQSGDPEKVMPMVLQEYLPVGVRGLVIAGLLAAFMSTFSATVNAAASYVVRDFWQPLVRPTNQKSLVYASYVATAAIVLTGTSIGFLSDSIRQIWDWLMIALGAAFVVPNVLRWYWWRLNGWGYSCGTLAGLAGAIPILFWTLAGKSEPPLYITFPTLCGISFAATLIGTWLTRPTEEKILVTFYQTIQPFGFWKPIRSQCQLSDNRQNNPAERPTLALINLVLSSIVILGCYLGPMYLIGHWYAKAAGLLTMAGIGSILLYYTWYRNLPQPDCELR
jgi:SSS family solute:Na+ symporter